MQKKNSIRISALLLALMLALCACAVQDAAAPKTQDAAGPAAEAPDKPDGKPPAVQDVPQTAAVFETDKLFSKRDKSAEYDDTVIAVTLGETPSCDAAAVRITGQVVAITAAGTYVLSGTLTDGYILVDAAKEDKVQLVLDGVQITSSGFASIYVRQADKVFITLREGTQNSLAVEGNFTQIDDNDVDAAIFSKDDLTINGKGSLRVSSPTGHGIVSKDALVIVDATLAVQAVKHTLRAKDSIAIASGRFELTAGKDGIHAEDNDDDTVGGIYIQDGDFTIDANDDAIQASTVLKIDGGRLKIHATEGLEATYVLICGGDISIRAYDDGVNASRKSSAYLPTFEMTDGTLTIVMGEDDTDGIDVNGDIRISGGTIDVTGNSTFDYDGTACFTGGTIFVNGQQVDTIPNQQIGGMGPGAPGNPDGHPGGGPGGPGNPGGRPGGPKN